MTFLSTPSLLITGATRGLGLAAARAAATRERASSSPAATSAPSVNSLTSSAARRSCSTSVH